MCKTCFFLLVGQGIAMVTAFYSKILVEQVMSAVVMCYKWKLVHMMALRFRCARHVFVFVWQGIAIVTTFLQKVVEWTFFSQFLRDLNETLYPWWSWFVSRCAGHLSCEWRTKHCCGYHIWLQNPCGANYMYMYLHNFKWLCAKLTFVACWLRQPTKKYGGGINHIQWYCLFHLFYFLTFIFSLCVS